MKIARARLLSLVTLLAVVTLSCRMLSSQPASTPTTAPIHTPVAQEDTPAPPIQVATPHGFAGTAVPVAATPVQAIVDDIQIDYLYTYNLVTALYHLYGSVLDHFVDVTLTNNGSEPVRVVVTTEVVGYTTHAIDTVEIPANESIELHQDPRLEPQAVDQLNAQKPGTFHIKVVWLDQGDEKVLLDETDQIIIYSRRDFVWLPGFTTQEEYELWAAWVTPNDPAVEALLRAAADYDSTGIIVGGYGDEPDDGDGSVWRRLEAVWEAEDNVYNLTYINTTTTFGPNSVQRMRLPAEVLDQASGNCVELAALYASVAEAMGLEAAIIRIPGHAYAAIRTDEENANYYFVETTLIGRATFSDAVSVGNDEWNDAQPHFDAEEEGYAWVTIPDAREKGILPIPWN